MLDGCTTIWFERNKYIEAENRYYLWLQKKLYGIDVEVSSHFDIIKQFCSILSLYALLVTFQVFGGFHL